MMPRCLAKQLVLLWTCLLLVLVQAQGQASLWLSGRYLQLNNDSATTDGPDETMYDTIDPEPDNNSDFNILQILEVWGVYGESSTSTVTFLLLLDRAELLDMLRTNEGFKTVLAPNDEAFAKMNPDELTFLELPENRDLLVDVLQYHLLLDQALLTTNIQQGQVLNMANGGTMAVTGTDTVTDTGLYSFSFNDQASIIKADLSATNGVAYIIDTVLIPKVQATINNTTDIINNNSSEIAIPSIANETSIPSTNNGTTTATTTTTTTPPPTRPPLTSAPTTEANNSSSQEPTASPGDDESFAAAWDVITQTSDLSSFQTALEKVNLDMLLRDDTGISLTVFAPINSALQQDQQFQFYLDNILAWNGHLTEFLLNHIFLGEIRGGGESGGLWSDPATSIGNYSSLANNGMFVIDFINQTVGGHPLQRYDLKTNNGAVHILEGVIPHPGLALSLTMLLKNWKGNSAAESSISERSDLESPVSFEKLLEWLTTTDLILDPRLTETSENGMTLVAPTDTALVDQQLLDQQTLLYHLLPGNFYAESLGRDSHIWLSTEHPTADMLVSSDSSGLMSFNGVPATQLEGQNG
jgi:uncharacterized surface protein with fasciclin (FAS1) repeats